MQGLLYEVDQMLLMTPYHITEWAGDQEDRSEWLLQSLDQDTPQNNCNKEK